MAEESSLKRASWLELFYDLVFVALVAQHTYAVALHHETLIDWLHIGIVGYLIFYAWWGTTVIRNIQGKEYVADKLFIQLQMVFAFLMSLGLPAAFEGNHQLFLWGYVAVRLVQLYVVERAFRLKHLERPNTNNIVHGIMVSVGMVAVASFLAAPYSYLLLVLAVVLEILNPLAQGQGNRVRMLNISHLQERLGLFLLLVMGESVLVVAIANTAAGADAMRPLVVFSGVIMMFALWWSYFHYMEKTGEGIRPKSLMFYLHAHAWLFGAVVLIAAAYKKLLEHTTLYPLDTVLLTLGITLVGACMIMIRKQLEGKTRTNIVGMLLLVCGTPLLGYWLGTYHSITVLAIGMTAWVCALVTYDEFGRYGKM